MNWLRLHWFDVGIVLALITAGYVLSVPLAPLTLVLWLNLIALFLHQFEEYRYPGTFPGMLNAALFGSRQPDRYPLNTNSALIVNVAIGWVAYLLAALLAAQAAWLGIAIMLVSLGNLLAHTLLFNIRGKRFYNPGMATALLLFALLVVRFAQLLRTPAFSTHRMDPRAGAGSDPELCGHPQANRLVERRRHAFHLSIALLTQALDRYRT